MRLSVLRFPLMAAAAAALFVGLWAGLSRLGTPIPAARADLVMLHGPLMMACFMGTLIGLERAVALGRLWGYAGPSFSGAGAVMLLAGAQQALAAGFVLAGSLVLAGTFVVFLRRRASAAIGLMALGAFAFVAGNAVWLTGHAVAAVVPWWMAFLALTIVGERLDLTAILGRGAGARAWLLSACAVVLAGSIVSLGATVVSLKWFLWGWRVEGLGFVLAAGWLWRHDIARRNIRREGQARFVGWALLVGGWWLGVAGAWMFSTGASFSGPAYDGQLHAVFVGFAFSMIFGHAPIIFPAVLRLPVVYRPVLYAPLVLLHAATALRVAGDLTLQMSLRRWGGEASAAAIVLFFAVLAASVRRVNSQR